VNRSPAGGRPIRRVVVVAKIGPPEGRRTATELADWLESRKVEVLYDHQTATALARRGSVSRETLPPDVDLVIVAGGDGTLLSVARSAAPQSIPILGINLGGLGFLTELHPDEQYSGLEAVLAGEYEIEERQTLRVRMERPGEPERQFTLLNDAVVSKSALARMLSIGVRIDDQDVATYTSDGLIVATPTGSTAYNLAAGGPILDPRMAAFVLAPICPHTMTHRPLVVPGSVVIEVFLHSAGEEVYLTLDGQIGFPFHATDRIRIDREARPARLVRVTGRSFFEVLRKKLRWGER
jgi:NAD+ kinase